jgi:tetratricopeptide (TPR) repeat protein
MKSKWGAVLLLLASQAWGADLELGKLRESLANQEGIRTMPLLFALERRLREEVPVPERARVMKEVNEQIRQGGPAPGLMLVFAELEAAVQAKELPLAYKQTLLLQQYVTRNLISNRPDPEPEFEKAREAAAREPSYLNFYRLAVAANMAKRYGAVVEAAPKALELLAQERFMGQRADPFHALYNLLALAQWEEGRRDLAAEAILKSLDFGEKRIVRWCPDVYVAEKLWKGGEREAVIGYFEKARKVGFPACEASIAQWLAAMQVGQTPNFQLPPPPPRPDRD